MGISIKRIAVILSCCILYVQCGGQLLVQAEKDLSVFHDDAAWDKAVKVEKTARKRGDEVLLCKALLIKGKVCDYAEVSADSNRNEEALVYLLESSVLADKHDLIQEKVISRYLISEVYVNLNRWETDSLYQPFYDLAGRWLDEGEKIAVDAHETELQRKAGQYRLRYLRQGGKYDEAIALCQKVIESSGEDNYLALQQMYDQLTALYTLVGDNEASAEAHAQYVIYTQKQISKAEEGSTGKGIRIRRGVLALLIILALCFLAASYLAFKKVRKLISKGRAKPQPRQARSNASLEDLTSREKDILRLMSEGKSTSDIARAFSISTRTVSNHKQNIYSKLGVKSSIELLGLLNSQKD